MTCLESTVASVMTWEGISGRMFVRASITSARINNSSSRACGLKADIIGRNSHQNHELFDHLLEDRGCHLRTPNGSQRFFEPDVDQEFRIIHRSPADEGGIGHAAVV